MDSCTICDAPDVNGWFYPKHEGLFCEDCEPLLDDRWALHLGLAIARFCRNARVAELVDTIDDYMRTPAESESVECYIAMGECAREALDELAAMARGDDRAVPR